MATDFDPVAEAKALAARTRKAQGLPRHIEDPVTLDNIAQIIRNQADSDALHDTLAADKLRTSAPGEANDDVHRSPKHPGQ